MDSSLDAAQALRRDLHLQRLQGCREAAALVEAVQAALAYPLTDLHRHVGPYGLFQPGADNSTDTHQRFYAQHAQQQALYADLCRRVIGLIGEPCHVQQIPTYRFGLPNNRWVGNYHRDSDFGHSVFELNAICALTPMAGSAALHVEQTPGAHDFAPLELAAGEQVEFAPGGYHLMLMKRVRPLVVGDDVEVNLHFAGNQRQRDTFRAVAPTAQ